MRALMVLVVLVMAASSALAGSEPADLAPSGPLPPAADNRATGCKDFRNRPVRTVEIPDLGDAGRAEFIEGTPVILLDTVLLGGLPANLQVFFKLHECAHHALGHLFAPTDKSEKQADCWAIQQGRRKQAFSKDDIISWKPFFALSRGDAFGHMPGPQRVEFLLGCFDEE